MRTINMMVFIVLGIVGVVAVVPTERMPAIAKTWKQIVRKYAYLVGLLLVANGISFAMTFCSEETQIYVEKGAYGESRQEVPLLLQTKDSEEEWLLNVEASRLTKEELNEKVLSAFTYLESNLKGENTSLAEVKRNLDYSLDDKIYPFDVEFHSDDATLIDEDGVVHNEKEKLLVLGYSEEDIQRGIPINVVVTLWYEDNSYERTYPLIVFAKERTAVEEHFAKMKDYIQGLEEKAMYNEGFYIPTQVEDVEIKRLDEGKVSSGQVLVAGVIMAALLFMREQENKKRLLEKRKEDLIRSYPWFVNELVLLLGAGMQVRNILGLLVKEYEALKEKDDYRKPLMEEVYGAVRAMELGMTEEQAYYRLGRRLGLSCYVKVMTLLEQNVKRGGKGLLLSFEQEELQALEERKNLAKRYGEEAGTKLLGPMILLLMVVMLIIMMPAFWGFA